MNNIKQLIEKDCINNNYSNIFPIVPLEAVIDSSTNTALDKVLQAYNHIYLPFIGNSRQATRLQIPFKSRRRGLYITYESCKGRVITEYYIGSSLEDNSWKEKINWVQVDGLDNLIDTEIFWYKA